MSALDSWKKKLGIRRDQRPKVQVQTTTRLETMTVTQEWRFKQLQRTRRPGSPPPKRAWYTLADAGDRLAIGADTLLRAAAGGQVACFVAADDLRGHWGDTPDPLKPASRPGFSHLRLPREACRDIEAYGSVNVTALRHPTAEGKGARFLLREPLWVDSARLLLKHPLPASVID